MLTMRQRGSARSFSLRRCRPLAERFEVRSLFMQADIPALRHSGCGLPEIGSKHHSPSLTPKQAFRLNEETHSHDYRHPTSESSPET